MSDGGNFIHSPLQALVAPSLRGDESIQPSLQKGPIANISHDYYEIAGYYK
jgi:hypothetical protein